MGSLLIAALALAGIAAAGLAFARTPRELRYRLPTRLRIEDRLAALPARAEAVIIKADWRRALMRTAPMGSVWLAIFALAAWMSRLDEAKCASMFGLPAPYVALLLLCYVIPIAFLMLSLLLLPGAVKSLKSGYFPPLDAVWFTDRIARKGLWSMIRAGSALLFPLFALYLVWLGHQVHDELMAGRSVAQIVEIVTTDCPPRR